MRIENRKVAIYSHSDGGTGNYSDELSEFLLKNNVSNFLKIDFPFGKKSEKAVRVKKYKSGKIVKKFESNIRFSSPEFLSYIKDFFYGIYYGFKFLKNVDLFFGMDNLLTLVGLFFKKIGFVKKVAYVVIDYSPKRYNLELIDRLYYFIDKICLYNSDYVLPLNEEMLQGRIRDKNLDRLRINYFITPFGNHSSVRKNSDYENYDKKKIVYFGGVSKTTGAELFIPIVKSLIKKGFCDFKFEVIGRVDDEDFKNKIKKNNLEEFFNIHGRVDAVERVEELLLSCALAIAPYYSENKNSFSYYSDPGKIKFYLGCGLPIIITNVPPIARIIQERGCGMISEYDPDCFADKIIGILSNDERYADCRKKSILFGKEFDWDRIFEKTLNKIYRS